MIDRFSDADFFIYMKNITETQFLFIELLYMQFDQILTALCPAVNILQLVFFPNVRIES